MRVEFIESCQLPQRYLPRSSETVVKAFGLLFGALLMAGSLSAATSPTGDVVGKLTVGYQGWFACANDGSPENRWMHWGQGNGSSPVPGAVHFDLYPDVREYTTTYQTGLGKLGNGSNAKLFSSYDASVVNKHFEWMRDYGIDTVALQRFGATLGDSKARNQKNGMATMVKTAAQTYGRKFYIMYDLSDWTKFQTEIKTDWTGTIKGSLGLLNSSAYAKQNGKPVVCIWGVGKDVGSATSWTDVINWFKGQGCYVIIGVPRKWRTDDASSSYQYANMISPWTIGAYITDADIDAHGTRMKDDKALCDSRGQDYQPVVYPGFSWYNWKDGATKNSTPRRHGDFMWRQFYQVRNQSIPSVYVAMFDEYDEGTAIAKAAENASMIPTNQWFLTLNYDGTACSADFYLRLTGDGAKMVKGSTAKVTTHPTSHAINVQTASCHIDTPTGSVTKNEGETLYVKVSGTDSDGIERVKLYTNGTEVASDSVSPYEFNLLLPSVGTFTVTAKVKDVLGNYTASDNSITVTVQSANLAPSFTSNPFSMPNGTVGVAYGQSFSAKAVDPEGGSKTFSKVSGPIWLTVTSVGNAQGTPGSVDVGTNSFSVKVTDAGGLSATATMKITVVAAPPALPAVGSIITLTAVNGKYVSATYSTNNALIANKTTVSNYERFKVVNATNSIALQCMGNNKFVSIDILNGSKPMVANRASIGSFEKFQLSQSGSQVAIRSIRNTNYVSAVSNGVSPLQASQDYIGVYEKFTWKVE